MASLTPLSKGLIGLAVVGAMASAVWHLGLKERLNGTPVAEPAPSSAPGASVPATPAPPSPPPAPRPDTNNAGAAVKAPDQVIPPSPPATPATPERKAPAPAISGLSPAENAEAGRKLLESKNYDEARVYLERAVQGGDGGAACHLGEMHLNGQGGLPVNRDKAASLFQLAQSRNIICFTAGR
jgi:hypothetical protein